MSTDNDQFPEVLAARARTPGQARPAAVRAVLWISGVRILGSLLVFAYAASLVGNELSEFQQGWVHGMGFDPASFGPRQLGELSASLSLSSASSALCILFIFIRRRIPAFVVIAFDFLVQLSVGRLPLVAILDAVLLARSSSAEYFRSARTTTAA